MKFDELEHQLPNGLHDAELSTMHLNYPNRELTLVIGIDVSDSESGSTEISPMHRVGRLIFSRLEFVVIDPPNSPHNKGDLESIDGGSGEPATAPLHIQHSRGSFLCWFFLSASNNFIRIAAESVTLEWVDAVDETN